MPSDMLKRKIAAYRAADNSTANGGLFTKLTLKHRTYDVMLAERGELGFTSVKVSESLVSLSAKGKIERRAMPATHTDWTFWERSVAKKKND